MTLTLTQARDLAMQAYEACAKAKAEYCELAYTGLGLEGQRDPSHELYSLDKILIFIEHQVAETKEWRAKIEEHHARVRAEKLEREKTDLERAKEQRAENEKLSASIIASLETIGIRPQE